METEEIRNIHILIYYSICYPIMKCFSLFPLSHSLSLSPVVAEGDVPDADVRLFLSRWREKLFTENTKSNLMKKEKFSLCEE